MSLIKWLAITFLPAGILFWIKKEYYAKTIQTFWEADIEPIKKLVRPGDFVVDLGANIGWYSNVLSSLVGDRGRVFSVEPIPDTFRLLSAVMVKRNLKNVEVFNAAVSDKDGSVVMEIPLHDYGGKNFYMAKIVSGGNRTNQAVKQYTVNARSLDSLFQSLAQPVSFIKCDVEGHELTVLKGARKFFEAQKPALMMEIAGQLDEEDSSANELFKILKGYGYAVYIFDGKQIQARPNGHWAVNYFFLQPSHLVRLADMASPSRSSIN
jgi:FkbM family methyltransferase